MVCVICLADHAPSPITIGSYEATLCLDHAVPIQQIVRKYIREERERVLGSAYDKGRWDSNKDNFKEEVKLKEEVKQDIVDKVQEGGEKKQE